MGSSIGLDAALAAPLKRAAQPFTFVQLSDSHIGFNKPPNADARATFREAIAKVKALPDQPDFIIHTGDVSQLSRDEEFDDADQMLKELGLPVFFVPGEHDMLDPDGGKAFLNRFGKGAKGAGWYSFDHRGVHFVALVNVADLKPGGMGNLGAEQLALAQGRSRRTCVVHADRRLRAHPAMDGLCRMGLGHRRLSRSPEAAGAVRIGHRAQRPHPPDHAEGRRADRLSHRALDRISATCPGTAPSPGPLKVPAEQLHSMLGITDAMFVRGRDRIALIDSTLSPDPKENHDSRVQDPDIPGFRPRCRRADDGDVADMAKAAPRTAAPCRIDNFTFKTPVVTVKPGTTVTWINGDDIPHTVVVEGRRCSNRRCWIAATAFPSLSPSPVNSAISVPFTRT